MKRRPFHHKQKNKQSNPHVPDIHREYDQDTDRKSRKYGFVKTLLEDELESFEENE